MWAALGQPLTSAEMETVEANAAALGVSVDALMERAGRAIAEEAVRHLPPSPAKVAILAGTGNNGGDGTCAAHYLLEWGFEPVIWFLRPPSQISSHSARRCFERVERRLPVHVGVPTPKDLEGFPLAIDAMLGTGQAGALRSPYREGVHALAESGVPTLAVDLPTGSRDPAGLRPQWTVALTVPKAEMDLGTAGELLVRDIGIPPAAWAHTGPGDFLFFPSAPLEHGGRRTRVLVIGGGPYAGAPALAALAALRSGAERATVVAPGGAAERIQSFSPDLVVRPVGQDRFRPSDVAPILAFLRAAPPESVVLGMGAGADTETTEALGQLIEALAGHVPLVIDADALRAVGRVPASADGAHPVIVTPNTGEFVREFGGQAAEPLEDRRARVRSEASRRGVTLVQKGDPDLISDGRHAIENYHHSPYQTVGGVGDVLGGVLGHLLGEGLSGLHAGRLGTYWVGEAGIRAAGSRGPGVLASDVIEELPATVVAGWSRVRHAE